MSRTEKDYEKIRLLGQGNFGKVHLAINPEGKTIALKIIDLPRNKPSVLEETRNEIGALQRLSENGCNSHVVCYYDSFYDSYNNKLLIEMEYVEGSSLEKYVNDLKSKYPADIGYYALLLLARDIADGLKYIHNRGVVHNDIKPANIMVSEDNVSKVVDFGLACNTLPTGGKYCIKDGGSPNFIPPEYTNQNKVRYPASDMWALGVSLYQLATGRLPFNLYGTRNIPELLNVIATRPTFRLNTSNQQLNELVNGLLVKDPRYRLTAKQVVDMLQAIRKPPAIIQAERIRQRKEQQEQREEQRRQQEQTKEQRNKEPQELEQILLKEFKRDRPNVSSIYQLEEIYSLMRKPEPSKPKPSKPGRKYRRVLTGIQPKSLIKLDPGKAALLLSTLY